MIFFSWFQSFLSRKESPSQGHYLAFGGLRKLIKLAPMVGLGLLLSVLAGCERIDLSQSIYKVVPVSPLLVEDGVDVLWKFKATVGNRPAKIMGIFEDRLPLGVTIKVDQGDWVISGKALRSRFTDGLLHVKVFDEDGCKQSIQDGLSAFDKFLARWNFKVRGQNSFCDYQLHQQNSFFVKSATFAWYSAQYATASAEPLRPIIEGLALKSLTPVTPKKSPHPKNQAIDQKQDHFFAIPPLEAPHQGLSFLDDCFSLGYGQCGEKSDCAWHAGSCASISKQNLKLLGK